MARQNAKWDWEILQSKAINVAKLFLHHEIFRKKMALKLTIRSFEGYLLSDKNCGISFHSKKDASDGVLRAPAHGLDSATFHSHCVISPSIVTWCQQGLLNHKVLCSVRKGGRQPLVGCRAMKLDCKCQFFFKPVSVTLLVKGEIRSTFLLSF